jgi:hypothetical protein
MYSDSEDIDVRVIHSGEDQIGYAVFDRDGNKLMANDIPIEVENDFPDGVAIRGCGNQKGM